MNLVVLTAVAGRSLETPTVLIQGFGVATMASAVLGSRRHFRNMGLIIINSAATWSQRSAGIGEVTCPKQHFAMIAQRGARSVRGQPLSALSAKLGGFSLIKDARLVIKIA